MSLSQHEPVATIVGTAVAFADAEGDNWRVTERECRGVPGARSARCLVFMSEYVFRRVWDYPAEWRTMSATALTALSWQR